MPANTEHEVFTQPDDTSIPVWRYIDFTKFMTILENESIYFPSADSFDDPYEGTIPHANKKYRHLILSDIDDKEEREKLFSNLNQHMDWQRQWTFISCWHMNEYESAAMWNLYSDNSESVALYTTYANLRDCLTSDIYIGKVNYIDYDSYIIPINNTYYPFMHKRKSFEHEREARALFQDLPVEDGEMKKGLENTEGGRSIDIQVSELLDKVYVAPSSARWFSDLVRDVVSKYNIDVTVESSSMNRRPVF